MKLSELIKILANELCSDGDGDVKICLLSECGDVDLKIDNFDTINRTLLLTSDRDGKWFKKKLKKLWKDPQTK